MNIVVFGANGRIGSAIVKESLDRGHTVTAAVRSPERMTDALEMIVAQANILDAEDVAAVVRGHHAVVNAVGGYGHDNPRISIECVRPLVRGLRSADVTRLLVVGTAGTLRMPSGAMRKDEPSFPPALKGEAEAQAQVLAYLRALPPSGLDWTYFSPPASIEPGERTGDVTLGTDAALFDGNGRSYISREDFAVAALDELEEPRHVRSRFTAISNQSTE